MSKDPAFLFYSGDCLKDVQFMSLRAQGVYLQLICAHMSNICVDISHVNLLLDQIDQVDQNSIKRVLNEIPGGFEIPWVSASIMKRRAYSESRKANRGKGKNKSDQIMTQISNTYVGHMVNENENENVIVNKTENEKIEVEIFPTFEDFWNQYDKKVGRPRCEKLWEGIKQRERESIVDHLDKYIPSTPDKKYRKNPDTYLRNKGWEDEVFDNNLNTQKNGNSKTNYSALRSELGIIAGQ